MIQIGETRHVSWDLTYGLSMHGTYIATAVLTQRLEDIGVDQVTREETVTALEIGVIAEYVQSQLGAGLFSRLIEYRRMVREGVGDVIYALYQLEPDKSVTQTCSRSARGGRTCQRILLRNGSRPRWTRCYLPCQWARRACARIARSGQ